MKKQMWIGLFSGLIAASAYAVPGEYWEVTTKMDMPGMPFAMPPITVKVCIPIGGEKNPQLMQKKDSNCQMSDVKTSGNKVTWKARCIHEGETMNGSGESVHEHDSYRGNMHLTGNSHGHAIDMTQTYSGKRIGGSCDSEAQVKEMTRKICNKESDCLPGAAGSGNANNARNTTNAETTPKSKSKKAKAPEQPDTADETSTTSNAANDAVIEGAKKLKGMFGF